MFLKSGVDMLQESCHDHQYESDIEDMKKLPLKILHLVNVADAWFKHEDHPSRHSSNLTSVVKDLGEIPCLMNGATKNSLLSDLLLKQQSDLPPALYFNIKLKKNHSNLLVLVDSY